MVHCQLQRSSIWQSDSDRFECVYYVVDGWSAWTDWCYGTNGLNGYNRYNWSYRCHRNDWTDGRDRCDRKCLPHTNTCADHSQPSTRWNTYVYCRVESCVHSGLVCYRYCVISTCGWASPRYRSCVQPSIGCNQCDRNDEYFGLFRIGIRVWCQLDRY